MVKLLRNNDVLSITGVSYPTILRLEAAGLFPRRIPITERTTGWASDEVQAWVDARIANREKALRERRDVGRRLLSARMRAA